MILTKALGITSAFTKSKKAKIVILGLEIAILVYAIAQQKSEKRKAKELES